MVQCCICHVAFDVSARSNRDIKAGRVRPRCVLHRRRSREQTIHAEHRRFWLDRFTIPEIQEMAAAIWPRPSQLRGGFLTADGGGPTGPQEGP